MNKYANLVGTNKIKDEYTKINTGFDGVETDIDALNDLVDALDSRVDTIITTPIDGEAAAQEIVDARASTVKSKTFATLDARFEETEQDVESHMAENVSQLIYVSRDISLDGVQIITGLIGIPKRIEIRAVITDWAKTSISIGSYELNGNIHSCYSLLTSAGGVVMSYSDISFTADIQIFKDEANYATGSIQNVTPGEQPQFEIFWNKNGTAPTGTVDLQIIAHYHGGV
jgi:hypothetical protein